MKKFLNRSSQKAEEYENQEDWMEIDDGEYSEEEYYAEEEGEYSEEEYYAEEEGEYSEEEYYAGEDSEYEDSYYEASTEDNLEYMDEEDAAEWDDEAVEDGNFFARIWNRFTRMDMVDRVVICTGATVLVLAVITGGVFIGGRMTHRSVGAFSTVGKQLSDISVIGGEGLTAVADARIAREEAAQFMEEEETGEYEEGEYSNEVTVALNMTSIKKDLKVKIINKKTGKLISNVPFEVTVTDSKGKVSNWKDDDEDGIIYKTDIVSGNYTVALNALEGADYEKYKISTIAQSVKVKETLDYEKVDVSDEIKDESEVDASKEDTAKNDTVEESSLQDTVTWVESTKTPISESYAEVAKSTIEDPATKVARAGGFVKLSGVLPETRDAAVAISGGGSVGAEALVSLTASVTGMSNPQYAWKIDSCSEGVTADLSVSGAGASINVKNTAATEGTVTVSVTVTGEIDGTADDTVTDGNATTTTTSVTTSAVITVAAGSEPEKTAEITISKSSLTLAVGAEETLTAKQGETATGFKWSSSKPEVAKVDEASGKVTAVAAGTADITVKGAGDKTAVCKVTVTNTDITIKLDKTSETLLTGNKLVLTAAITGNKIDKKNITWTSSDANIAEVKADDSDAAKAAVTGKKAGDVKITASYKEGDKTVTAECTIKVKNNPAADTTTALKDKNGNQIYVQNAQGQYVAATYADYYKDNQKFYLKQQGYKYTGWQTLDGKVYFFDVNGNKVTGAQVIQGAQYSFDSNGVMVSSSGVLGIDVSKWNGNIDWNAVKNSGVSYVIIRCGYRGSSQGSLIEDPKYRTNIKGATDAGLKVGVYFFTQAVNEIEAVEEASMVLSLIKGYKISYPVFLDVESSGGRADGISKETRTAVCKAFCQTIKNSGYTAGIYANKTWLNSYIDAGQLSAYRIWLAQYAAKPTYTGRYDMWQYSSKGKVGGISGNVDMNLSYMGY